jgi:hypothetical protein
MKRNMAAKIGSLVIAITVILVTSGGVSKADNSSGTYKATCAGSYTNDPNFSYDGEANDPLAVGNLSGHDNIEGKFVGQDYTEDASTSSGTCTAPDGTTGTDYPLVADNQINTYPSGDQLYLFFSTGHNCSSDTTASFGGDEDGTVIGGSGKLANASGPVHESYVGVNLSVPAPPGFGYAVPIQITITGTVTR